MLNVYESDRNHRKLLADRYQVLVYRQLRNGLESDDIFCRDSVRLGTFKQTSEKSHKVNKANGIFSLSLKHSFT